jgi:TRAP-type mannitol/chloroaromatic compound transport system permease small subunit
MKLLIRLLLFIPFLVMGLFASPETLQKFDSFCEKLVNVFELSQYRQRLVIPLVIARLSIHSGIIKIGKSIAQLASFASAKKAHNTIARQSYAAVA